MNFISRIFRNIFKSVTFYTYLCIVLIAVGINSLFEVPYIRNALSFIIITNSSESLFETIFGVTATIVTLQTVLLPLILEKSNKLISICTFIEIFKLDAWPFNPYHLLYISIAFLPVQYFFTALNMLGSIVFIFFICCFILFFLFYSTISLSNPYRPIVVINDSSVKAIRRNKIKLWEYIYHNINNRIVQGLFMSNDTISINNAYNIVEWLNFIFLHSNPKSEYSDDIKTLLINMARYSHLEVTMVILHAFIKFFKDDEEVLQKYYRGNEQDFINLSQNCLLKNNEIIRPIINTIIQEKERINITELTNFLELGKIAFVKNNYEHEISQIEQYKKWIEKNILQIN